MACRLCNPPLVILALIHLGIAGCILTLQFVAVTQVPLYLYLALAAVGVWTALDHKSYKPVVSFITMLVICAVSDVTIVLLSFLASYNYGLSYSYHSSFLPKIRVSLGVVVGINLLGKIITLIFAAREIAKRKMGQHDSQLESGKWNSQGSLFSQDTQKFPPPPSYNQLKLMAEMPGEAYDTMSPVKALQVALKNHPAAIELAKLAAANTE